MRKIAKDILFFTATSIFFLFTQSYCYAQNNRRPVPRINPQAIQENQKSPSKKSEIKEDLKEEIQDQTNTDNAKNSIEKITEAVKTIKKINKYKSLMFQNQEIDLINNSIEIQKNGGSLNIEDDDEKKEKEEKKEDGLNQRSQIHLGSILYFSKNKWVIWLNKSKVTSEDNNMKNEFYVNKITSKNANITWRIPLSKWKILVSTSVKSNPKIIDNYVHVNFTLRSNQTFSIRTGQISEGKSSPPSKIEEK